jgi:predicted PurR-regulated permease PerM
MFIILHYMLLRKYKMINFVKFFLIRKKINKMNHINQSTAKT